MNTLKKSLLLLSLLVGANAYALNPIADGSGLAMIKDGVTIETKMDVSSIEGEDSDESILRFGDVNITFYGTKGKKLSLKAGTLFKLVKVQKSVYVGSSGTKYNMIQADLVSDNPKINSFKPNFQFFMNVNEGRFDYVIDLREQSENLIEFYYAPGDGDVIEL